MSHRLDGEKEIFMLGIKNVADIEKVLFEKESQIKECSTDLVLLKKAQRSSKWIVNLLDIIQHLLDGGESIEILKKIATNTWLLDTFIEGFTAFDEGWLSDIEIELFSIRKKIIPLRFHDYIAHRRLEYLYKESVDTKVRKICSIIQTIESINAWCLHRLYVLDENPRFGR